MDANATTAVTPALGKWVSGLRLDGVPHDVLEHLKTCLLDSLGCGLFGTAPVLAGSAAYAFGEAHGWKCGLENKPWEAVGFYSVIAAATLLGIGIINL